MERTVSIPYGELELKASIHYPEPNAQQESETRELCPLILICHGFIGNRIGVNRLFVNAARKFAKSGYIVVRFDYAGCGESEGEYGEGGLDSLISQTRTVLDYALESDYVDLSRVTLLGHSLGGAVALLTAARDRRIKSLILWSAVAHPFNDIVRIVGRSTYDDSVRNGSADHMGYALKPVFFESLASHQPFAEAGHFSGDVFLVHGTSDDVIPPDYASLYQKLFWARPGGICDLKLIFQADHTFSSGEHQRELYEATLDWLNRHEQRKEDWAHWEI
jgi:pimeloyl-ACP methyl ester carboxylesterase